MGRFGGFVRARRAELALPLRIFCQEHGFDPSNWSKLERGRLAPPQGQTLEKYAKALKLKKGSTEWFEFFDLASAETGRIPPDLAEGEVAGKLPILFRTLRESAKDGGQDKERLLEELKKIIRET
jgi:transcriptional regulator with XRE-family HTH domain